jgi:hypothetical protein
MASAVDIPSEEKIVSTDFLSFGCALRGNSSKPKCGAMGASALSNGWKFWEYERAAGNWILMS